MQSITADVAVIGAGSAGLAAYRAARSHGKRVVLIEAGPYGTTCARVGCMPSKLLIAAAEAAHGCALAPAFGIHPGAVRIDGREVMTRVRRERDRFVGFVLEGVDNIDPADRLRGRAQFLDAAHVQIDDHTIVEAARVVIATGSRPQIPPELLGAGDRLATNDTVFDWDDLPSSVAVIGTGVIGLELGQALHRLGVRVAIFGRGTQLAGIADPMVLASAQEAMGAELDLRLNTRVVRIEPGEADSSNGGNASNGGKDRNSKKDSDDSSRNHACNRSQENNQARESNSGGVVLTWRDAAGSEHTEEFAFVLAATGRIPNLEQLQLSRTGIALDARGIPLFDPATMRCGDSSLFIAGDVANERPLLHEAADHGRIAGDNAGRYPDVRPGLRRAPLAIAFTDPQIAVVGGGFRALEGARAASGEVSFVNQGRSRVMLRNQGLLRVYGEYHSERFLGAELCGPSAEHLAHLMAWALQAGMTIPQMLDMPFYHPVVEEGLRTALRELADKLKHGLPEIEHCADCTPGM